MNLTHEQALDLAVGYVLGTLVPQEEQAVREHLDTCPETHAEFAELGSVVHVLAESVEPVEPPPSLRARIMAAAAADLETRGGTAAAPSGSTKATRADDRPGPAAQIPIPPSIQFPGPEERAERRRRRTSGTTWVMGIAAALVIAALGAWNVILQRDLGAARDYQTGVAAVLDVANDEGTTAAVLRPQAPGDPGGLAAVAPDGRVAIALRDLDPLSGSEVYEAWVIVGSDPVPIPIGGFKPGPNGTATFVSPPTAATAGATIALTREPGPGATTPTMPILAVGQAVPPPAEG